MSTKRLWVVLVAVGFVLAVWRESALAIPPFARKYGTSCITCHYAYPKLNGFGQAFKNNGYRYPTDDETFVKEEPLSLGSEAYKRVFPEAIWPSTIPGKVPVGVWAVGQLSYYPHAKSMGGVPGSGGPVPGLDENLTAGGMEPGGPPQQKNTIVNNSFDTPTDVEFLFGGTLGESISFFGSGEFDGTDGSASANFKVGYNPWTFLNLTFGMVDPDSAYNDPDRLTIQPYNVARLSSVSGFNLNDHQAGLEVWGAVNGFDGRGGLEYAAGVVNGPPGSYSDDNSEKDFYARASYKFIGHPVVGASKEASATAEPWRDDQVKISGFVYHGIGNFTDPIDDTLQDQDRFWALGSRLNIWYDRLQVNAGYMTLSDDLGNDSEGSDLGSFRASAWYVESNYLVYPWLIPVARFERANLAQGIAHDATGNRPRETNIIGGITLLPRANVKLIAEYFRGLDSFRSNVDAAFLQLNVAL